MEMTISLLQAVVEQYKVDENRIYTTGQSKGCMMSFYFNITHLDLFAAPLFESIQCGTSKMKDFAGKKVFYVVAGGDKKASGGMSGIEEILKQQNVRIPSASCSAKSPLEEQECLAEGLITNSNNSISSNSRTASSCPNLGKAWSTWLRLTTPTN